MISLITLLSITENIRKFNHEYGGYYLGHDTDKVAFGYTIPLKPEPFNISSNDSPLFHISNSFATEVYYNDVLEFIDANYESSNILFGIPSLDDAEFIANKLSKYQIHLSSWIMHNSNRGVLAIYNFKKRNVLAMSPNHQMTRAPLLLMRYIDILK
jgi:hypothetical protein